ncbi:unnamed protein product, partial [Amoebophrya sp. A25]
QREDDDSASENFFAAGLVLQGPPQGTPRSSRRSRTQSREDTTTSNVLNGQDRAPVAVETNVKTRVHSRTESKSTPSTGEEGIKVEENDMLTERIKLNDDHKDAKPAKVGMDHLQRRHLTTEDVIAALSETNVDEQETAPLRR